ncbi:MAG: hypothetical protein FWF94_08055 [Oscillospiraceae bacterium]|nr:hypothetical protein [Oscillospiraceae bacterium]
MPRLCYLDINTNNIDVENNKILVEIEQIQAIIDKNTQSPPDDYEPNEHMNPHYGFEYERQR